MEDLSAFRRDLLYVIAEKEEEEEDRYGLAIKDELEGVYGEEVTTSRLYPNLDTLVDKGLVEKGIHDNRSNEYSLTTRGRRELEARREWENQYVSEVEAWNI